LEKGIEEVEGKKVEMSRKRGKREERE